MDETFHALADLYLSRTDDIMQLFGAGAGTLVHGDAHIGNLFVDGADDRTGFLDWAVVCRAPGMRDVAYTMCNSVPRTVREAIERGIVEHYCALLAASGVALDPQAAWDQYRLFAVQSWAASAATAGVGSKWQPIELRPRRHSASDRRVRARRQRGLTGATARMTDTNETTMNETAMHDLYRPMFLPDLLILGLERNGDRPAIHIDGEMRTAAELRDEISRYVQVFRVAGRRVGERRGDAVEEPRRGAVLDGRGDGVRLSEHAAASAGVARRPRVRARGRAASRRCCSIRSSPSVLGSCASVSPGCGDCCRTARPTSART